MVQEECPAGGSAPGLGGNRMTTSKRQKTRHEGRRRIALTRTPSKTDASGLSRDASDHLFENILDFLPDATLAIDTDGVVIAWNRALEKMTGIPASKMLGKGDYSYAIPYYGYPRPMLIDYALKPSEVLKKNYPYIKQDGDTFYTDLFVPAMPSGGPPAGCHLWVIVNRLFDRQGKLIGAIESTRDITRAKQMEADLVAVNERLAQEQSMMEKKNTALQEILGQIDAEHRRVSDQIQTNMNKIVMPLLSSLKHKVGPSEQEFISILTGYLNDITAPFTHRLESNYAALSPRELEICNLIRNGLSCKDIASTLNTSVHTVLNQRQRIRRKMGLNGKRINLSSYLKTV